MSLIDFDFRNSLNKECIIIFAVVVLICMWFSNKSEVFVCKDKYSFCSVDSVNTYNIARSNKIFIANQIQYYEVEKYRKYQRRGASSRTRYRLKLKNTSGASKAVFAGYRYEKDAQATGNRIIDCINKEQFPCRFNRFGN